MGSNGNAHLMVDPTFQKHPFPEKTLLEIIFLVKSKKVFIQNAISHFGFLFFFYLHLR